MLVLSAPNVLHDARDACACESIGDVNWCLVMKGDADGAVGKFSAVSSGG